MKINNNSAIGAVLVLFVANAGASDWTQDLYINADVGSAFQQNTVIHESFGQTANATYNPGIRGDISLGYNISDLWTVELSTGVIWNTMDKVNGVQLNSLNETFDTYLIPNLANVIFKVPTKSSWSPYLGVGVGAVVSVVSLHAGNYMGGNPDLSDSDFNFAYQAEAGLDYSLTKNISIGVNYKFLGMLGQNWYLKSFDNHLSTDAIYTHAILVNLNWSF
jgi:opacity protein-like surface antigen